MCLFWTFQGIKATSVKCDQVPRKASTSNRVVHQMVTD